MTKRKKWARMFVKDADSVKGRRELGRVAAHHTFCGCFYCRRPKLLHLPTAAELRSSAADFDNE